MISGQSTPWVQHLWYWLSNDERALAGKEPEGISWLRLIPFAGLHVGCLTALWVGVSWFAVAVCIGLYALRMFFITGFFHRYFSHRAFKASRIVQFAMGVLGCTAGQRGPLWWAAHHRQHHASSDTQRDPHSPHHHGFWYSHLGWFLTHESFRIRTELIPDWMKYRELWWLERFDWLPLVGLGFGCYALGDWAATHHPTWGTSGWQVFVWGFVISTVTLYHCTYSINSLAHRFGRRRYATTDESRNNVWLALLTFGEGWHNNHHHYPGSARQGFFWWEIDITYYVLRLLAWTGLISKLRTVSHEMRAARREVS
ncbi:MAG: acyl-CoA desaturase [Pseudomonadota bacterium]